MGWQNQIGWLVNSSCCPVHVAQWLGKAITLCKLNLPSTYQHLKVPSFSGCKGLWVGKIKLVG